MSFLGISAAAGGLGDVEVKFDHPSKAIRFIISEIEVLSVRHEINLDSGPRDAQRYISCLCFTGRHNAGDIASIQFRGNDASQRLGFVFPATCFSEAELFSDGGWRSNFAEVGFRKNLTTKAVSAFSRLQLPSDTNRLGELAFSDVFSEYISVLVASVDGVKATKMSMDELELSLIAAGIYPLMDQRSLAAQGVLRVCDGNYNIRRVSSFFRQDSRHFIDLFRRADQDSTGVGAFLTYYQVVEHCISYILGWSIDELKDVNLDAWRLRDELSSVANEKRRLKKLHSSYMSRLCDYSAFEDLRDKSLDFLRASNVIVEENWSWCDAVYKARNVIVHNQIGIFRSGGINRLGALNSSMRSACLEIITHFMRSA